MDWGVALGLLFALLIIWLGFWRMVFGAGKRRTGVFSSASSSLIGDQTLEQIFQRLFPSR